MESLDNQYKYWNSVAHAKIFTHPFDFNRFQKIISTDAAILDIGCGYGRTYNELYGEGFRNIVGIDTSNKMIERGQKTYPHLHLTPVNGKVLPYGRETFDAVILFAVLTCIPTNRGQESLLDEIYRVLRPGGTLYISDYWIQVDHRNQKRYTAFQDKYERYGVFELLEGVVVRHHDVNWIQQLLSDFLITEQVDIQVKTMNNHVSDGFQLFGKKQK